MTDLEEALILLESRDREIKLLTAELASLQAANPAPPGPLKDSGARRTFSTGSVRDLATGKGLPHLRPFRALCALDRQMERGAVKYSSRNWEKGQPLSALFDSLTRHLEKHFSGWTDEPHADAIMWNAAAYVETVERIRLGILPKELDDRPVIGIATAEEQGSPTA